MMYLLTDPYPSTIGVWSPRSAWSTWQIPPGNLQGLSSQTAHAFRYIPAHHALAGAGRASKRGHVFRDSLGLAAEGPSQ